MKIRIESTSKIVTLVVGGKDVPARVWQGETDGGIPVQCFITRIAPEIPKSDPNIDDLKGADDTSEEVIRAPTVEAI